MGPVPDEQNRWPGQDVKDKMNKAIAVAKEEKPAVHRPVQALLLGLWAANIAFFLYFLLKYGLQQPW